MARRKNGAGAATTASTSSPPSSGESTNVSPVRKSGRQIIPTAKVQASSPDNSPPRRTSTTSPVNGAQNRSLDALATKTKPASTSPPGARAGGAAKSPSKSPVKGRTYKYNADDDDWTWEQYDAYLRGDPVPEWEESGAQYDARIKKEVAKVEANARSEVTKIMEINYERSPLMKVVIEPDEMEAECIRILVEMQQKRYIPLIGLGAHDLGPMKYSAVDHSFQVTCNAKSKKLWERNMLPKDTSVEMIKDDFAKMGIPWINRAAAKKTPLKTPSPPNGRGCFGRAVKKIAPSYKEVPIGAAIAEDFPAAVLFNERATSEVLLPNEEAASVVLETPSPPSRKRERERACSEPLTPTPKRFKGTEKMVPV